MNKNIVVIRLLIIFTLFSLFLFGCKSISLPSEEPLFVEQSGMGFIPEIMPVNIVSHLEQQKFTCLTPNRTPLPSKSLYSWTCYKDTKTSRSLVEFESYSLSTVDYISGTLSSMIKISKEETSHFFDIILNIVSVNVPSESLFFDIRSSMPKDEHIVKDYPVELSLSRNRKIIRIGDLSFYRERDTDLLTRR